MAKQPKQTKIPTQSEPMKKNMNGWWDKIKSKDNTTVQETQKVNSSLNSQKTSSPNNKKASEENVASKKKQNIKENSSSNNKAIAEKSASSEKQKLSDKSKVVENKKASQHDVTAKNKQNAKESSSAKKEEIFVATKLPDNQNQPEESRANQDTSFTEQLEKMLAKPFLSQSTFDDLLNKLNEECLQNELVYKALTEERIKLEILKAEAEAGFASASKQDIEEKKAAIAALELKHEQEMNASKQAFDVKLSEKTETISQWEEALFKKENTLLNQQKALSEQQANASAGFVLEQKNAIEQFKKQITEAQLQLTQLKNHHAEEILKHKQNLGNIDSEQLNNQRVQLEQKQRQLEEQHQKIIDAEAELAQLKNQHAEEITKHKQNLGKINNEYLNNQRTQLEQKQRQLDEQQQKLIDAEAELEAQKAQLKQNNILLQARQRSQTELEKDTQQKIRDDYAYQIDELERQLGREKNNVNNAQKKNEELNHELLAFADLKQTFEQADAAEIHEKFRQLQQENRNLKAKQFIDDEDLGEKCEILEEQLADRTDELKDLRVELEGAKAELHKRAMSVMEKQNLAQQKRVLEQHNLVLETSIEQLSRQIDDLIERQQGAETFPALSLLDKKHRHTASNLQPVPKLKNFADQLRFGMASIYENSPLYYREEDIRIFLGGLAMSNLHILQGMSGTGKTSLAKAFSRVVGGHCTDIAVQAGWRDKDDLLGHYNAFEKRFYEREALQAIYRAQLPEYKDRINIILLDEMNLSRPEQYFAEFLSALEMRPEDRKIVLVESEQKQAPIELINGRILKIPENIWFIGTANHDETTNEFADKTYDRAHVMELLRNEDTFNADQYEAGMNYSFQTLKDAFEKAYTSERSEVEKILQTLSQSSLSQVLEDDFSVSWGNRFSRHALRFLPVVKHAGGSFEEALDHLLATKIFRPGKATGRYDLAIKDLDNVATALTKTWQALGWKTDPSASLTAINKDRKRMERGV